MDGGPIKDFGLEEIIDHLAEEGHTAEEIVDELMEKFNLSESEGRALIKMIQESVNVTEINLCDFSDEEIVGHLLENNSLHVVLDMVIDRYVADSQKEDGIDECHDILIPRLIKHLQSRLPAAPESDTVECLSAVQQTALEDALLNNLLTSLDTANCTPRQLLQHGISAALNTMRPSQKDLRESMIRTHS